MELLIKLKPTPNLGILSASISVADGGALDAAVDLMNLTLRVVSNVVVVLTAKDELAQVLGETHVGIGRLLPKESRSATFTMTPPRDNLTIVEIWLGQVPEEPAYI